jgi:hypothetical protein
MSLFHMSKLLNGYDLAIELYDLRRGTSWIVRAEVSLPTFPKRLESVPANASSQFGPRRSRNTARRLACKLVVAILGPAIPVFDSASAAFVVVLHC